ncbi:uncharacterized protein LOC135490699 isoform X3 [Lineus longissimus]|uniref:uncharacterized protein LOC135490699 isoform X3 n=1 Tax=Lineus longissimus TaxID=88925 RepID=UPI00315E02AB
MAVMDSGLMRRILRRRNSFSIRRKGTKKAPKILVNDIPENRRPSDVGQGDQAKPLEKQSYACSADNVQCSSSEDVSGRRLDQPSRSCVNLRGGYKDGGETVQRYGGPPRTHLSPDDAFNYYSTDEYKSTESLNYDEDYVEAGFRPRSNTQPENKGDENCIEKFKMSYRAKALSSGDVSSVDEIRKSPKNQRRRATAESYSSATLPSKLNINDLKKQMANEEHRSSEFDIVGQTNSARYPWQRDIGIQCTFFDTAHVHSMNGNGHTVSVSSHDSFNNSDATFSDNSGKPPTPVPKPRVRKKRKGILSLGRPKSIGSTDDIEHQEKNTKPEQKPSKFDIKGQRPHSVHLPSEKTQDYGNFTRSFSETLEFNKDRMRRRRPIIPAADFEMGELLLNGDDDDEYESSQNQKRRSTESSPPDSPPSRRRSRNSRLKLRHHNSDPTAEFLGVEDEFTGHEVLSSPRVSPVPWMNVPELIITQTQDNQRKRTSAVTGSEQNLLRVPRQRKRNKEKTNSKKQLTRRASIGSIHSTSEDSDDEPSTPPVARRGRRAAIYESKTFGDVSPTSVSPEVSPANSCDESEDSQGQGHSRLRRRRSSVDLGMQVYPGDLLMQEHHKKILTKRNTIADFASTKSLHHGSTVSLADQNDPKKVKNSFSFLKLIDKKTRSKECLAELEESLGKLKGSEFKDNHLASYKDVHWSDLIASRDEQGDPMRISETERKRREAVWEIFKSELIFLIDHLMVLKHCFMEPMKQLQVDGHLMYSEPQDLLGNLDELCYVSYTFCRDFISLLLKDMSPSNFGSTSVLVKAFKRFAQHSKNGEVYHTYCLNYTNALNYLEQMRKNEDFCEFEKWCETDPRCKRLQLTDLLVAPMQHCTKLPLLLNNIRKYTTDPDEKQQLTESLSKTESYLKSLEEKMRWLKNFERVQEIQHQLVWQPIHEMDPRVYIPEFLKHTLGRQPCERLLASPKRQLIHEGQLMMMESSKPADVFVFLFDDILLLTKTKGSKPTRKKSSIAAPPADTMTPSGTNKVQTDQSLIVYKQPIALDRFTIHDVGHHEASVNGLKHAFVLVQISRFQQIIGVYTLQAATDAIKATWLQHLREAKERYKDKMMHAQQDDGKNKKKSPRMLLKHLNLHPNLTHLKQHQHKKSASISQCQEPTGRQSPPTPKNTSSPSSSSPEEVRANHVQHNGERNHLPPRSPSQKNSTYSSPQRQESMPMQSTPPLTPPMDSPLMSPLPLTITNSLDVQHTIEEDSTRPRPPRLQHLKNCQTKSKSIDTVYL